MRRRLWVLWHPKVVPRTSRSATIKVIIALFTSAPSAFGRGGEASQLLRPPRFPRRPIHLAVTAASKARMPLDGGGPISLAEFRYAVSKGVPHTYIRARSVHRGWGPVDEWWGDSTSS